MIQAAAASGHAAHAHLPPHDAVPCPRTCHLLPRHLPRVSSITNKSSGKSFCVEGVEVDLFSPAGQLQDIWLFRDPMDFEEAMLRQALAADK